LDEVGEQHRSVDNGDDGEKLPGANDRNKQGQSRATRSQCYIWDRMMVSAKENLGQDELFH